MTIIKICGVKDVETALAVSQYGADFMGFIFAQGRRQLSPEQARTIAETVQENKFHPSLVGVFVNTDAGEVNRIAEYCRLDYVQFSGNELWEYCRQIERPVIKVIHVTGIETSASLIIEIETGLAMLGIKKLICLLDSGVSGASGGTGKTFDWQIAKEVAAGFPVMVAGGLSPGNVSQLVSEVNPWGVDVSSGVETGGKKDITKIKDFIEAVRVSKMG